ncbi:MAG: multicopper oxidase family protein [Chlorobium sp.]|nr:MAG: multicopper oxidase family protein [Chlorobium sp.]
MTPQIKKIHILLVVAQICLCGYKPSGSGHQPNSFSGTATASSKTQGVVEASVNIPEPSEIRSINGRLDVTLEGKPSKVIVAGKTFVSNVFNGSYIPPVLVVQRGDEVRIRFVNNVGKADIEIDGPQPSNIHTHGMAISPQQPADNAFVVLPSGASSGKMNGSMPHGHDMVAETPKSFPDGSGLQSANVYEYRWKVPPDHAQGLHWYHPHAHGMVEPQVLSGMSGLLVVDGFIQDHYPELAGLKVRRLLLKDIDLPGAKDGDPKTKTINGVSGGIMHMQPGEHQIWEIGNVGSDAFFDLALDGHQFWILGHDGNILLKPVLAKSLFLPAGARVTVVVQAGAKGSYALRSLDVDTGPAGDPNPMVILGKVVVNGPSMDGTAKNLRLEQKAVNRSTIQPVLQDVISLPVTRKRTITFSESRDGKTFYIDGKEFDPARDDITVHVGDVEEWTLLNTTTERHIFHIHQLDFLVEKINENDPDATGLRDTIDLPYAIKGKPGMVRLKIPFTNPLIVGRFPYHCHILEHEDHGMMATVRVLPKVISTP